VCAFFLSLRTSPYLPRSKLQLSERLKVRPVT
jgi:hypothetical protein